MTSPAPSPPPSDAGKFLAAAEGIIKDEAEKHKLLLVGLTVVGISLLWTIIALVTRIDAGHTKDLVAIAKSRQMAALADSVKANAAMAKFWRSEAAKKSAAVAHDTQLVTRVIDAAPKYYFTPTGMRVLPPDSAPPAPVLDTASPGHQFGTAVPYAVTPNTQFYRRASDFDTLAVRAGRAIADLQERSADQDSAFGRLTLVEIDERAERDTARADNARIRKSERSKVRSAAIKGFAVGGIAVLVARALLH